MANLVYELLNELLNDLKLMILGNKEILEKISNYSSQKLNFENSSQKTRKSRYKTFLVLSNFTEFLYFLQNILSRIVWANSVLVLSQSSLLQTLIFWYFGCHQSISQIFKDNVKQVICVALPNLMALCSILHI